MNTPRIIKNDMVAVRKGKKARAEVIKARILAAVRIAARSGLTRTTKSNGPVIVANIMREGR